MTALYDSKTKTINDYGVRKYFSNKEKYKTWLFFEKSLATAQAKYGIIPDEIAIDINNNLKIENIDFEKMNRIYEEIGHGFVPFLKVLVDACNEESGKYIHYGITTQNIQQSSEMYIMKKIHYKFMEISKDILNNLSNLAEKYSQTIMPGRTHGRHATPITYGYKVSAWISELISNIENLIDSEKRVFKIMMGGAVGTFSTMPKNGKEVQNEVGTLVNMEVMEVPSRNINTHKIEYINNLTLIANVFHKIAEEVYSTSVEEIAEVTEIIKKGTIGSSTMPHKINPKLSKGIIANSQKLYSLPEVALHSSARIYEGDSSSYMLIDGIVNEAMELMTEIILRAEELTRTIQINTEKMNENANINKGLDNSENIMMIIADRLGKDKSHSLIYELTMQSIDENKNFLEVLKENEDINDHFTLEELTEFLKPENYIGQAPILAELMSKKASDFANKLQRNYC
ncbi:class-II fumarase/aspartase family protein [Mammaliicoccus lentus]|uniref:class-II fumarase/aspartase family protein n=1 Tax=Mammaliicoccus lentus TaxID=42858 RepID=UPI0026485AA3|nr:adenylosuccinate lyase family protein [Mammaliicoccus lentus]